MMASPRRATFGVFLKDLRESAGLARQQDLADKLTRLTVRGEESYSRSAVAAVERGDRPGKEFVDALVRLFPDRESAIRNAAAIPSSTQSPTSPVVQALRGELETLRYEHNDPKVLRYHESFSRFLFLEAEHETRVLLGTVAEEAAARLGERAVQAAALIDDLGWSQYVLNQAAEAEASIRHGLDVAEAYGLPFWQAKAYRHLSGMALEAGDFETANEMVSKARERADVIPDDKERSEMQAGVEYATALIKFAGKEFEEAKEALAKSENLRKLVGDHSRTVKVHAMFGKLFEQQGKPGLALDKFREGLAAARAVGRRDEQVRNLAGLSRVLRSLGREAEADAHESEGRELGKQVPVPYEELASSDLQ